MKLDIERHTGIIWKKVGKYHHLLPFHVRATYDFYDMVSEVTMHVLSRQKYYSKKRGKEVTFVGFIAENQCRVILSRQRWAKRNAETLSFDVPKEEYTSPLRNALKVYDQERQLRESRLAVERMLQFSSAELREAWSDLLTLERLKLNRYTKIEPLKEEARKLAQLHHVTADDFRRVIKGLA